MSLIGYRLKRNFSKTTEPKAKKEKGKCLQRFIIQEHQASRLHYDFRLETIDEKTKENVLKSWAVPKNLPLTRGVKHLAIQTEDHPVAYINFEGEIPLGNYGTGKVTIWDKGKWGLLKGSILENRLSFNLLGEKIKGRYIMIKIKNMDKNNRKDNHWLIWKKEEYHIV